MSITDELREFVEEHLYLGATVLGGWKEVALMIVDRIDAEHERMWRELTIDAEPMTDESMAEHGWMRLPVDADGVPIHVGDVMDFLGGMTVSAIGKDDVYFFADNYSDGVYTEAGFHLRHHHAPTVEDVLDEFANAVLGCDNTEESVQRVIAEYAARLRLAEEVD